MKSSHMGLNALNPPSSTATTTRRFSETGNGECGEPRRTRDSCRECAVSPRSARQAPTGASDAYRSARTNSAARSANSVATQRGGLR
jgi:hypothetical protein